MEYNITTAVEVEAQVGFEPHLRRDAAQGLPRGSLTDDGVSASSSASAAPNKQSYTVVVDETTPLLPKSEAMSSQLSSPIEIAGIEGAEGAERPWIRIPKSKRLPWWETPSVSIHVYFAGAMLVQLLIELGLLAHTTVSDLLPGDGRRYCSEIEHLPQSDMQAIPFHESFKRRTAELISSFYNRRRQ